MRFEKEGNFIEVTDGISADNDRFGIEVWFIETNLDFKDLPIEFRAQVLKSDVDGYAKLEAAVLSWTYRNEYMRSPKEVA